jgi:antitoxin component YwqK of YwqJK toxin-antitoxin module
MTIFFRNGRWSLAALVSLAATAMTLPAQQPLSGVQVAEAVPAKPAELEPTPAAAPQASAAAKISDAPADAAAAGADSAIEVIKERYPSGAVKIEREMIQDAEGNYLMHGAWRQYDEQGRLIIDGRLEHNRKEGLWRRFYRGDETQLFFSPPYKDFKAPFISTASFHADALEGTWTITDAQQRKIHELQFTGGHRDGQAIWYYPSGAVMLQTQYELGSVTGEVVKYAPDGAVIAREQFQAGRKLGPKVEYHEGGQFKKQEVGYLHAQLVVKAPDSWEQGKLATFETRGHDERHGSFIVWHANGQIARQGEFRYDLPVGKVAYWFSNGQQQLEGQYVDGRQEGPWTWWHENGQKAITGEYRDAKPIGQWSWWTASGKLSQKADLTQQNSLAAQPREPVMIEQPLPR